MSVERQRKLNQYSSGRTPEDDHRGGGLQHLRQAASLQQKAAYCSAMKRKYERAAERPWIIVSPDPPYPWDAVTTERFERARARFLARKKREQENTDPRQLEASPP